MSTYTLEEITKALKEHWPLVFKKEMDNETDIDPYLLCGFVQEALDKYNSKMDDEKLFNSFLNRTSFKNVSGDWQFKGDMTPKRVFSELVFIKKLTNETE
jgi:hypothetical protein